MKYTNVYLNATGYELGPKVVASSELEGRLSNLYESLRIRPGQLEALTGIRERRWWDEGFTNAEGALRAAKKALAESDAQASDVEVLVYAGVCRDHLEPATACDVAAKLDLNPRAMVYDISNACLGVLNGIVDIANRIELGQVRAGLVVSCESSREITETMIEHMLSQPDMEAFRLSVATLTGGSGAVAYLLTDGSFGTDRPRLCGGVHRNAPEHFELCRWEVTRNVPAHLTQFFQTDGVAVLKNGIALGMETWNDFLAELDWKTEEVDRTVCHQVGAQHRNSILKAFGVDPARDYPTFEYLGNMGTVSLPLTAALAAERGVIDRGHRVAFLGIGSGLNCLMLGWEW